MRLTDLKPHVLRYWESQFRFLNPAKNRSGNRVYQRREIELIMLVKHLLYTEKYTIDGARQQIDEQRKAGSLRAEARAALDVQMIRDLERQLQSIVKVLDGTEAPIVETSRSHRAGAIGPVTSTRVACVVPALNAAPTLAGVVTGLRAALPPTAFIIVVDDGSRDETHAVASAVADATIRFPRTEEREPRFAPGSRPRSSTAQTRCSPSMPTASTIPLRSVARRIVATADLVLGARDRRAGGMPVGRRLTNLVVGRRGATMYRSPGRRTRSVGFAPCERRSSSPSRHAATDTSSRRIS